MSRKSEEQTLRYLENRVRTAAYFVKAVGKQDKPKARDKLAYWKHELKKQKLKMLVLGYDLQQ